MNFENELMKLINQNNAEVSNLRKKAINGNRDILQGFLNVIMRFLMSNNHKLAYQQINQLLISAKPQIAAELDNNILPLLQKSHCFQNLDEYIILWKRIMNGNGTKVNYPNLNERFKFVKLKSENKKLSSTFVQYERLFQKNLSEVLAQKVQFFEQFDGDSFATQSINADNFSEIIELDMQQIKHIKQQLEKGEVQQINAEQFVIKIKNFLSLNSQLVKQQYKQQFNSHRTWSRWFILNYKNWIKNGKLNLHQKNERIQKEKDQKALTLPEIPKQNEQINTGKSIKIWQQAQEIKFQQTQIKKMNRVNKLSEKLINSLNQPQSNSNNLLIQTNNKPKIVQPQFILDTTQMKQILKQKQPQQSMRNSKSRPKIFGNNSRISQLSRINNQEQPLQTQLVVTKHTKQDFKFINKKQNLMLERPQSQSFGMPEKPIQNKRFTLANNNSKNISNLIQNNPNFILQQNQHSFNDSSRVNYYKPINQNLYTPINKKNSIQNLISPNTGFQQKTAYSGTPFRKLSQLKQQKRLRKLGLMNQQLSQIQNYLIIPYYQFFDDNFQFSKFRRNCFEDNSVLYSSSALLVTCAVSRSSNSKANIQIIYQNKTHSPLTVETLYRIPKCLKIQKNSKITKKCSLRDRIIHNFSLELSQFPLEPCALNLKYVLESNSENLGHQSPTIVLLPFTIRNFMESIMLNQQQFISKWTNWSELGSFRSMKNIVIQSLIANQEQLQFVLKDLTILSPIEGYSFKQFGGYFLQPSFKNLTFLLRISQRIGTIVTLQLLANRRANSQDQIDYMEYCLNIWSMLLSKIQISSQ